MVLPLPAKLYNSKTAWVVLTEATWAPGKIPDKRSMEGRDELTVIPVELVE